MRITVGKTYTLRNQATLETAQFILQDMKDYQGQLICYGEVCSHTIYVPATKGVVPVRNRPGCFPVFPREQLTDVTRFMADLDCLPLILIDGDEWMPVVNVQHDGPATKERAMENAADLVRRWQDWKREPRKPPPASPRVLGV